MENIQTFKVKTIELVDEEYKSNSLEPIIESIGDVLGDLPLIQAELLVISEETLELPKNITVENKKLTGETNTVVFVGANLLTRPEVSYIQHILSCSIVKKTDQQYNEYNDRLYISKFNCIFE